MCSHKLLLDCEKLFDDVLRFLRSVGKDEFRDVAIQQWKDGREKAWPKYKFDHIVEGTLRELGRTDLDYAVVCNQHLKEMQDILAATVIDEDRLASIKNFIEQRICEKYPLPLPIRGKDLIDLGIPPGPRFGEILGVIREKVAAGESRREVLLDIATQLAQATGENTLTSGSE
ncbi:MAG: hypothetical protein KDA52_08215 [Planctomycetaceae bacterium]|nr:hypothetical protein [Planctomycetaceae bacterium]